MKSPPVLREEKKSYKTNSYARFYLVLTKNSTNPNPVWLYFSFVKLPQVSKSNDSVRPASYELFVLNIFHKKKKCEEKLKFIDRVEVVDCTKEKKREENRKV